MDLGMMTPWLFPHFESVVVADVVVMSRPLCLDFVYTMVRETGYGHNTGRLESLRSLYFRRVYLSGLCLSTTRILLSTKKFKRELGWR